MWSALVLLGKPASGGKGGKEWIGPYPCHLFWQKDAATGQASLAITWNRVHGGHSTHTYKGGRHPEKGFYRKGKKGDEERYLHILALFPTCEEVTTTTKGTPKQVGGHTASFRWRRINALTPDTCVGGSLLPQINYL